MGRRHDTVSFLSDLGTADELVGVVKAVLRDLAPHATVLDLAHGIAPFDVRAGSLALARAVPYLPSGVVLASVDPGAGSARRAIAIQVAGGEGVFVGPDNGLLAPAIALTGGAERAVVLHVGDAQRGAPGATFAARDVFAPAAAALCNGVDLGELGEEIDADLLMPGIVPLPREEAGVLLCEVLWVDRFGNCQLNVGPDDLAGWGSIVSVRLGEPTDPVRRVAHIVDHFDAIDPGAPGLVVDAHGMLALALARRSAAEELGLATGELVVLAPLGDDDAPGVTTPVTLRPSS